MKVSVIIPSFNRADLLPRTIKSVAGQTYTNLETIIIDDCSEDNTLQVVEELKVQWPHINIKYIRHQENKGESGSRNTGIENASGDYVAFLDSDDEWLPDKIMFQMEFLKKNHSFDGVICEYFSVIDGKREHVKFRENILEAKKILTQGSGFSIGTNLLVKRSLLRQKFDVELRLFADIDWLYRTLLVVSIGVLHQPLALYYKAPMRQGDYIKTWAEAFAKKYQPVVRDLGILARGQFYSTLHWYAAVAYDYHRQYKLALRNYIYGMVLMPFRHPGNYKHILKLVYVSSKEKLCG